MLDTLWKRKSLSYGLSEETVKHVKVVTCSLVPPAPQRAQEVPDPSEELVGSHRGSAGEQGPQQPVSGGLARPAPGGHPAEPPGYLTGPHKYTSMGTFTTFISLPCSMRTLHF